MTTFALRLQQHQARLVALAVSYHLARPGSEIDRDTMQEYEHGLGEILPALDAQLEAPSTVIAISALQTTLLSTALSSALSELKMYSVFDTMSGASGRPRSTAPGFDQRLRELFPEVAADPAYTMALAEDIALLRRELPLSRAKEVLLEEQRAAEDARKSGKKPWQFWKR